MKSVYLWLIRLISLMNVFRPKKNLIYFMSFGNNLELMKALADRLPAGHHLIVFYGPGVEAAVSDLQAYGIRTVAFHNGLGFALHRIPLVMTARVLFLDNYYAFLGGLAHPHTMKIVQLWHANGAIKQFGWEDKSTADRTSSDKRRFSAVYRRFDDFVVASTMMGKVFENSYGVSSKRMQLLGYPRSDRLFDDRWIAQAKRRVYRVAPELTGKRVILYAPTYRDGVSFKAPAGLGDALAADPTAVVVAKLHPLLSGQEASLREDFRGRINFYDQLTTTDLLTVAETVVTDYSSVAFDYSVLPNAHTLLFFMFDLDAYRRNPGIQSDLLEWLPTPPLMTVDELEEAIRSDEPTNFADFNEHWNTYNDGQATKRVVDRYINLLK